MLKLYLLHLPFQAQAAGNLCRSNTFSISLRILKLLREASLNLGSKSQAGIRVREQLTELLLNHLSDHRFKLVNCKVLDSLHAYYPKNIVHRRRTEAPLLNQKGGAHLFY